MYFSMFTNWNFGEIFNGGLLGLGLKKSDYIVLIFGIIIMTVFSLIQRKGSVREQLTEKSDVLQYAVGIALFVSIITFGAYGIGYDSNQFIYNQF
jgi:alginate O-acetyltransferase complex protein AlgI